MSNVVRSIHSAWSTHLDGMISGRYLNRPVDAIEAIEASGQNKRTRTRPASHRRRGRTHRGDIRRYGRRSRRSHSSTASWATKPATAPTSQDQSPHPSLLASPLDALGEIKIGRTLGFGESTKPSTWHVVAGALLIAMLDRHEASCQGARRRRSGLSRNFRKSQSKKSLKGMDINPVSLQLAASQLTTGNQDIRYRQMGLHLDALRTKSARSQSRVSVGTLELLGQKAIVT